MDSVASNVTEDHGRTIIHIDMDYFYAQVEEIRDPSLKSKPLGIQQKSMVVTSNYIAREFGVKKLMSVTEAKKLCPNIVLVNGEDLTNYRQTSSKLFELLHKYTPLVEKLGLDENFLDVSNLVNQKINGNYDDENTTIVGCIYPTNSTLESCLCGCAQRLSIATKIAKDIRDDILKNLNLTCSAGIAHNKLLAKLVGSMNKPNNQTVLIPVMAESFMRGLDSLQKITGIGHKTEIILRECGVMSVTDLQNCDFDVLKEKLGYESAFKLKELSFGRDASSVRPTGKPKTIGLEDSCRPISVKKDVEERFRLLLMRLVNQVSEDGRIPVAIKIILRKFDPQKKTSHRETKQANILPSLFKQLPDGQIMLVDSGQVKLLKIVMRLFERIIDMTKPFNITLLGLAFSKFQERKFGSSSIANFLIKKSDLEVQSVTSLKSEGTFAHAEPGDEFYRRRTTASPIPMLVDAESLPSDVSDFSETEVEPSPKKSRLGLLFTKRRCLSTSEMSDIASPSKLRVAELRLNSRDSEKDLTSPTTTQNTFPFKPQTNNTEINNKLEVAEVFPNSQCNNDEKIENNSTKTTITGNLANIPCPAGVDPDVFKQLPIDVQNELISSWRNSLAAKSNATHSSTTSAGGGNTLHRYFIKNK